MVRALLSCFGDYRICYIEAGKAHLIFTYWKIWQTVGIDFPAVCIFCCGDYTLRKADLAMRIRTDVPLNTHGFGQKDRGVRADSGRRIAEYAPIRAERIAEYARIRAGMPLNVRKFLFCVLWMRCFTSPVSEKGWLICQ